MTEPTLLEEAVGRSGERLNVGLVGSSGGHLAHLLILKPWWENHDRFWVTFDMPDSHDLLESERCDWAHYPTTRNVPNLIRNFGLAWKVLRRERPDVIISTGAAVAFPFFLLGRLMGVKTVFIEVYDRIDSRTMTGWLVRPLTTRFCVQWPQQQSLYPGSVLTGPLY